MSDIEAKWEFIKKQVCTEYDISDISYKTWINPLKILKEENNCIYILIPEEKEQLISYWKNKYSDPFLVTISEVMEHEYDKVFFVSSKDSGSVSAPVKDNNIYNIAYENANLNPNFNFDKFVIGNNNQMAQAVSIAVAENPCNPIYNPFYIYGESGLGKTHLMQAIGNYILEHNPSLKVLYVTSETFTNEIVDCLRNGNDNSLMKFRDKYRTVDVLMIDDVQFLIGKAQTQQEFFHTFNELYSAGKQIILSSDRKPDEMKLDDRLIGRLSMGYSTNIVKPDYETRIAILMKKAESININVSRDVINYIAENINSNIRILEGALNKIYLFSKLNKVEMTVAYAEEALKDMISPSNVREITPKYIVEVTCEHYGINVDDILSTRRNAQISLPRQVCMYLCRKLTEASLNEIGNVLGNRDHTTVIHGIEKIEENIKTDKELNSTVESIIKKLSPE